MLGFPPQIASRSPQESPQLVGFVVLSQVLPSPSLSPSNVVPVPMLPSSFLLAPAQERWRRQRRRRNRTRQEPEQIGCLLRKYRRKHLRSTPLLQTSYVVVANEAGIRLLKLNCHLLCQALSLSLTWLRQRERLRRERLGLAGRLCGQVSR